MPETEMGGADQTFRTTLWTAILAAGDPTNPDARPQLDRLVKAYWRPVYAYIRVFWKAPAEEAKDLTQSFFGKFIEKEYWSRLDPQRGSFRGYLKAALHHFLVDARKHDVVRRAIDPVFSFDAAPGELERLAPASPDETPERAFEREWVRTLLESSIDDLRGRLERDGKSQYYEVFRIYSIDGLPGGGTPDAAVPTYREIGDKLGLKVSDVQNFLARSRRLLWQIVRERVREYVATEGELEGELKEILGE